MSGQEDTGGVGRLLQGRWAESLKTWGPGGTEKMLV